MKTKMLALLAAAAVVAPAVAAAQDVAAVRPISGTRLDVSATGSVTRVPDVAIISAGVQTLKPTASAAIEDNAVMMERVRAALKRAGIADKDIQTSSISLSPEYRYTDGQPPVLTGYRASNSVNVKFRDLKRTGAILDALVAQGANQISGPNLTIDKPEEAQNEARLKAIADGRARADLYARSLGMRVVRILSISESGGYVRPPMPYAGDAVMVSSRAKTEIDPGTQDIQVGVSMSFELQ
ncbi:SIMPL domain-containing protein [Sphingomonas rhizophila]|uniref:SIMPL domain-containing protein n=1 Tax=Sphingomonas rhizophila TaxID=2071607 RepID=A0A7G9SBG4_9SPHN|nr:SIMPL domain-containing protein [Sphingomonas rhizophila]QNN65189.1 SIMPL domain-containing protein [Sphingomonas rhizophila]